MPKALFFNIPAHGHINPSLPLVAELSRRGHALTYFATETYRAHIERAGASFRPYPTQVLDDAYFTRQGLHGGVPQRVACHLVQLTEELLPTLLPLAQATQPDYILFDGLCPWGYFVARILGVPAVVSLALMPPPSPPPQAILKLLPASLKLLPMLLPALFALFRDVDKALEANRRSRALGKKYGVPPLSYTALLSAPGDMALSYTSTYFQPFADTAPKTVRFVGWTLNDAPPTSEVFEPPVGKPLIYISLGTLNNTEATFFKTCIDALADWEAAVLISTGKRLAPNSFGPLPANIVIQTWVPQTHLLQRAALFVTHGGMNSLHEGLYCGVPLLLVPQQLEQIFNAHRVVELGAGLMLSPAQLDAKSIRAAAAQLLHDSRFKTEAERIGRSLREAGGARRAADEVEALLRTRPPKE